MIVGACMWESHNESGLALLDHTLMSKGDESLISTQTAINPLPYSSYEIKKGMFQVWIQDFAKGGQLRRPKVANLV